LRIGLRRVHSVSAGEVSSVALFSAAPWRTFRWHFGQRHYAGTYWSATQGDRLYLVYNYPRAAWQTAQFLPLVGRYIREKTATLRAAALPDVPVRVLVPRLRAGVPAAPVRPTAVAGHDVVE
jgi:hypothetical protein